MWGKDLKVIWWHNWTGSPYLNMTEVTNAHCICSSVILQSWQRICTELGPCENHLFHAHKCVLSVLCQSASISLAPFLTHTYTYTHSHTITHTTRFSQNTHGGERLVAGNVKLLCHVQSKSGSRTSCVYRVGMCVCSAQTPIVKASSSDCLGAWLSLRTWQEFTFMTKMNAILCFVIQDRKRASHTIVKQ